MKSLWIGIGAAAVFAAAAAGYVGMAKSGPLAAKSTPRARVSGPVQGSSFDAPAIKKATPTPEPSVTAQSDAAPVSDSAESSNLPASGDIAATPATKVAAVAPSASPASAVAAPTGGGAVTPIKFDLLASYKYQEPTPPLGAKPGTPPPTPIPNQIPQGVLALDKQMIEIEGYMVPMEVTDEGKVKTFILTKNQPQCCFGDVEAPNEWIDVKMQPDQTTEFMLDRPVRVKGALEVGELLEDGFLVSLYRMTAESVSD